MGLPTSNSTTYVATAVPAIKAQDLNDLQTWEVFLYNNRYALITGDGSDSSATLDGAATVAWASKSGSTYTMTRPCFCTTLTVNNGTTLNTGGYPIYASTSVTLQTGSITACNGNTGGASRTTNGYLNLNGAGGTGGTTTGNPSTSLSGYSYGRAGATGGTGNSGAGGTGGSVGSAHSLYQELASGRITITGAIQMLCGGSGGGGGGGDGTAGGAGGEAGGLIIICSPIIALNSAAAQATGGTGAPGAAGNRGGGGGGGGGAVVLIGYNVTGTLTVTATGGNGGAGSGTGTAGGTGTNGSSSPTIFTLP